MGTTVGDAAGDRADASGAGSPEELDPVQALNRRRVTAWRAVAEVETLAGRPARAGLALRIADEIEGTGSASEQTIEDFRRDLEDDG